MKFLLPKYDMVFKVYLTSKCKKKNLYRRWMRYMGQVEYKVLSFNTRCNTFWSKIKCSLILVILTKVINRNI